MFLQRSNQWILGFSEGWATTRVDLGVDNLWCYILVNLVSCAKIILCIYACGVIFCL